MSKHRTLSFKALRHMMVCTGLALLLVSIGIPGGPGYAQKRVKPEVVLPLDYPDGFHGFGPIDALDEDWIVIGDIFMELSPLVTFHTPTKMNSDIDDFNTGDRVGYLKNSEGEIISLWLIP